MQSRRSAGGCDAATCFTEKVCTVGSGGATLAARCAGRRWCRRNCSPPLNGGLRGSPSAVPFLLISKSGFYV
ncbi:hypothetical protein AXF42_Ash012796 [Apostasia shenzhenica]|uniref:Uncharacterized protein n=1 Tax=Apostasia shenzhenica TaxID=1088818 RepID=A0A2I0AJ00_9ASPA|nr:hypothetical protein AXF42_Ash006731 [Apostasia shenzhenica]PKA56666.1 hypothetical protein AXF42_Ash012796 [Apostasia shenzhenica]